MRRATPGVVLAALGTGLLVVSLIDDGVVPVVLRLMGVALLAFAAPVAFPVSARRIATDAARALREDSAHTAALVAIVVIGAAVRIVLVGLDSRYDEAYAFLTWTTAPIRAATTAFPSANNHLLNTVLEHGTWRLLGDGLWAIRLPALAAGVLTIPAVYAAGRLLHGRHVGLLAAALAAGAGPLIEYSANGRGYALCWLGFAVLVALSARLVERPDPTAAAWWMLGAGLAIYAIPVAALFLVPTGAWLALCVLRASGVSRLPELVLLPIGAGIVTLVLYAGLLDDDGWSYEGPGIPDTWRFVRRVWGFLHLRTDGVLEVVAIPLVLLGIVLHRRTGRQAIPFALVVLASVPVLAVALPNPPPFERTWAYLVVTEVIAVAAGAVAIARRLPREIRARARGAFPVAMVLLAGGLTPLVGFGDPPYSLDDAPVLGAAEATRWLRDEAPTHPLIVSAFTQPSMTLHFRLEGVSAARLRVGGPALSPGEGAALVAVSRTRRETLEHVLAQTGFAQPHPKLRRARTFDELDIYAFADPG